MSGQVRGHTIEKLSVHLTEGSLQDLLEKGWTVLENCVPEPDLKRLIEDCRSLAEARQFTPAGTGKGAAHQVREGIRSDKVHWWDPADLREVQQVFWNLATDLRLELNQAFFTALQEIELHYAIYKPGAYYQRHLDQFKTTRNRIFSLVFFLNPNWDEADGGQLRLYPQSGIGHHDIFPNAGRLVVFRSDLIEHEVLAPRCQRLSLTGWIKNRAWPLA